MVTSDSNTILEPPETSPWKPTWRKCPWCIFLRVHKSPKGEEGIESAEGFTAIQLVRASRKSHVKEGYCRESTLDLVLGLGRSSSLRTSCSVCQDFLENTFEATLRLP